MRNLVFALGLLLVGGATAFAQEMRMPINGDDENGVRPRVSFQQGHKSPSSLAILSKKDCMLFD